MFRGEEGRTSGHSERSNWADDPIEDGATNQERPVFEVNVFPLQNQQLTVTHPGGHGQDVQGV